jgi:hypothetical protein
MSDMAESAFYSLLLIVVLPLTLSIPCGNRTCNERID